MSAPVLPDGQGRTIADLERRLALLERRGPATALDPAVTIPAPRITAGAFGAGDYTFPGGLAVSGALAAPTLTASSSFKASNSVGTGLYVRAASAVVDIGRYLDFHTTGAADEAADYSARFNCWSATDLDLTGVNLHVTSGSVRAMNAQMHQYDSTYAAFGNKDMADYQIMCRNTGLLLLRAPGTDQRVLLGTTAGGWDLEVHSTLVRVNVDLELIGTSNLKFATYGGGWYMSDTTWVRTVGGKSLFTSTGTIMTYGPLVAAAQQGSSGIYLWNSSDTNHRLFYDGTTNGPVLMGWGGASVASAANDVMLTCGRGTQANRHVNRANSVWRYSDAQGHTNMSDPRFKRIRRALPAQAQRVRGIAPIEFQWDEKHDVEEPGRLNFGFNADDLPPEVIRMSYLTDEETGEPRPVKMMDPVGVLAMLWRAFTEEADRNDRFERRLAALEIGGE